MRDRDSRSRRTGLSLRYAEAVIVVGPLLASRLIRDSSRAGPRPRLDAVGGALSAGGLALAVLSVVQSTE